MNQQQAMSLTFSAFADELDEIKLALSLKDFQAASGVVAKHTGPGGAVLRAPGAATAKTTLRGQSIPGLAQEQKAFQAVSQANQQMQGARSLL